MSDTPTPSEPAAIECPDHGPMRYTVHRGRLIDIRCSVCGRRPVELLAAAPVSEQTERPDRCPTCGSVRPQWRHLVGREFCNDPWHSSPVDSPAADTPNPADVLQRAVEEALGPDAGTAGPYLVASLERAGLRVVQVPDGLPDSESALLARLDAEAARGEWVQRDMQQFAAGWRAAAALLGGEDR